MKSERYYITHFVIYFINFAYFVTVTDKNTMSYLQYISDDTHLITCKVFDKFIPLVIKIYHRCIFC